VADGPPGGAVADGPPGGPALAAEIESLREANRVAGDAERERRLLHLRNLLAIQMLDAVVDPPPQQAKPDFDGLPRGVALPEIAAAELTPELLRAGILRHGCLLVRGLVAPERARALIAGIDRAFAARTRHEARGAADPRYYSEFEPDPRQAGPLIREWIRLGGGLLAADSPGLSFELSELLAAAGLPGLVEGYLGEPPLLTVDKTTLRRAEPSTAGAWHQDGAFMGQVKALNLWLSLSHCGDTAPGLDVVPRRLEAYVQTQTEEARLRNQVSQRMAEEAADGAPILRPLFDPGDALLFDELFLHKTASDPGMREPRYAVESWFFAPSGFPRDYAPLTL